MFTHGFNLRVNLIIGGDDITTQLIALDRIPHIVNDFLIKDCGYTGKIKLLIKGM